MKKVSRLFILSFLMLSALLPPGADAALCFEENTEVDIHFLECETEHQGSNHDEHSQEISENHEDCSDLKLLCSIETSLTSFDLLKLMVQKAPVQYSFSSVNQVLPRLSETSEDTFSFFTNQHIRVNPRLSYISSIQILV